MKHFAIAATLFAIAGFAQANPTVEKDGALVSKEGRTLYTFDKDASGKSSCSGGCAAAWPPFAVANPALAGGDFSIIVREDGGQQWVFRGKPLYFYAGDTRPGERNGDNQGGVWHMVGAGKTDGAAPPRTGLMGFSY